MIGKFDFEAVWATLASIGMVGSLAWNWLLKQKSAISETKARVAEDDRDRELATSAQSLYNMMNERLKNVESELKEVRLYNRKLELHVGKLERTMRDAGLTVPSFD